MNNVSKAARMSKQEAEALLAKYRERYPEMAEHWYKQDALRLACDANSGTIEQSED